MKTSLNILVLAIVATFFFSCSKEDLKTLVPKTADQDSNVPSIVVNGARLHSEAFGHPDSTLLVCVHGGPGSDYRIMLNMSELADHGYRVVFYDQRGCGLSQRFPEKHYKDKGIGAIDELYDELSGVIAHYRTSSNQKVFLFGKSWGGMLATGYVGKYPEAVQGLIVSEPGGLKWEDIKTYVKESRSMNIWSEILNDAAFIDQFLSGDKDDHEVLDYKVAMRAARNPVTGEDLTLPGSFWRFGAVFSTALMKVGQEHEPDFSAQIYRFQKPVLFFHSEQNKAYPESWAQKISSVYPSVTRIRVARVGHNGIVHDHNAWSQTTKPAILNYLNSF